MNPFEMVVLIVLIVTFGQVLRSRFSAKNRNLRLADDPEAQRLHDDVKVLKDRVAVLERIATDKNHLLEQEFERLRDR
jgi:hypothetical protein